MRRSVTSVTACPYANQLPPQHTRTEGLRDNRSRIAVLLRSIPDAPTKKRPTKRSAILERLQSSITAFERHVRCDRCVYFHSRKSAADCFPETPDEENVKENSGFPVSNNPHGAG